MRKEIKNVEIQQIENGYIVQIGINCSGEFRDRHVFQSFTELINFLNIHFTFRNELIYVDYNNQNSIVLK